MSVQILLRRCSEISKVWNRGYGHVWFIREACTYTGSDGISTVYIGFFFLIYSVSVQIVLLDKTHNNRVYVRYNVNIVRCNILRSTVSYRFERLRLIFFHPNSYVQIVLYRLKFFFLKDQGNGIYRHVQRVTYRQFFFL